MKPSVKYITTTDKTLVLLITEEIHLMKEIHDGILQAMALSTRLGNNEKVMN